jgi:hypothetical protein
VGRPDGEDLFFGALAFLLVIALSAGVLIVVHLAIQVWS